MIRDEANIVKHAVFTAVRWVKFCEQIPQIDTAIERAITLKPTNYRCHIGGNCHIKIKDKMPFADIHRWYLRSDENELWPFQVGIVLTLAQWNNVKTAIDEVEGEFEDVESCCTLVNTTLIDIVNVRRRPASLADHIISTVLQRFLLQQLLTTTTLLTYQRNIYIVYSYICRVRQKSNPCHFLQIFKQSLRIFR